MTQVPIATEHLEIKLNGENKKLFMSYGLLNRLTVLIGGNQGVPLLATEPDVQEKVLLEVFTVREKKEIKWVPEDLEELEVSIDDVSKVLDWVGGNITSFFLKQTEKAISQAQKTKGRMESLQAIADGISASPSSKPAA